MNKKASNKPMNFLRRNCLFLLLGVTATALAMLLLSAILGNIKHYETLYPAISIFLCCLPAFLASLLAAKVFKGFLIPIAAFHGICVSLIIMIFSAITNGSFSGMNNILPSCIATVSASVIAALLSARGNKKYKKHH